MKDTFKIMFFPQNLEYQNIFSIFSSSRGMQGPIKPRPLGTNMGKTGRLQTTDAHFGPLGLFLFFLLLVMIVPFLDQKEKAERGTLKELGC